MMEATVAHRRRIPDIASLGQLAAIGLPVLGALVACWLSFSSNMPVPIERPWLLGLGALAAMLPFTSPRAEVLQGISVFYLMSIPVSELSTRYFTISIAARPVGICYSVLILCLCGIGYAAGRLIPQQTDVNQKWPMLVPAYALALAVIAVHMLGLSALLTQVYGYGFERDLNTLGQVSLYLLLLLLCRRSLGCAWARRILVLGLGLGYLALAFAAR
jgi:hypothetical protein